MGTEKYFAFISYSRKDSEIARAICQRLESFRYPSEVEIRYRPKKSKYVREIFFDRTKLECSDESFHDGLREALSASRYLIVICSANSAVPNEDGKHYVNDEITYFLEQHDGNRNLVIPVLLDGCIGNLPPSLNTESIRTRNNPICLREEGGVDEAVAQILNYLFRVKLSILRARLNSQRLRFFRTMATIGIGLAIVFSVMTFAMFMLKSHADRNRRLADDNAREAERQASNAMANEKEAKRQAEIANRNAEEAERERKLASQSLDFMVDTFKRGDPLNAGQYDVRMIDILKARIPDIVTLEPWELRAEIGCQVGSLLHNIGLFEEATNLLFTTVALNMTKRPQSPETAFSLYCASWCFMDMHDIASALSYAQKALNIYENAVKRDPLKIALVCNAIGVFYMNSEDDIANARQYLNRVFDIRQKELGGNHVDVAMALCNLGYMYEKAHAFETAVKAFSQAVKIYQYNGLEAHIGTARAWRGLGLVYIRLKEYEKAIDALNRALEIQISVAGRNTASAISLYREIGFAYRWLGNYSKALDFMKAALVISRKVAQKTKSPAIVKEVKELEGNVFLIEHLLQNGSQVK